MATYQLVAIITPDTAIVTAVNWVDIDTDPPSGWPSYWITTVGKVNSPFIGSSYVPFLNGFVRPQPNPTFDLRTSDLTWQPSPDIYYYWTNPIEYYNLWDALNENWELVDYLPPVAQTSEIVTQPSPVYSLTCNLATVVPGGTVEVTLENIDGEGGYGSVNYEILGPAVLQDVAQVFNFTVGVVPGTSPPISAFLKDGVQSFGPFLSNSNKFEYVQDDLSNDGNTLLLSTTVGGTHNGGTVYTTGVEYWLDGMQVLTTGDYLSGFDAATTRKLTVTVDPAISGSLYPFSSQTGVNFEPGDFSFIPNELGKYGGSFFSPLSGPSTLYITVEPLYVPSEPTEMTVKIYNGPTVQQVSFTILPAY